MYAYEYGRASGVICNWVEAERGLNTAYNLDRKTNNPIHMDLVELARMNRALHATKKSAAYFKLAKDTLDKKQMDTRDSIGYANFLGEYHDVLISLGNEAEAKEIQTRELEIRAVFNGSTSDHERTPYGKYCEQTDQALSAT